MRPCEQCGKPTNKKRFCSMACKSAWPGRIPVSKEWLRARYIDEGLDCPAIARMVNRDNKSVWSWLKKFNIPTRSRGCGNGSFATRRQKGQRSTFIGRKHSCESREKMRQARLRDGGVPYLKDGKPWMKGRKGPLAPTWKGGCTPLRQKVSGTQQWKDAVKAVWKRDDAVCQRCGLEARNVDFSIRMNRFHVHHIVSFSDNEKLRCEPSNLVLLCNPCHKWVHSRKNKKHDFLNDKTRWKARQRNRPKPVFEQLDLFECACRNLRDAEGSTGQGELF